MTNFIIGMAIGCLIVALNVAHRSRRKKMTIEQRKAEDEETRYQGSQW